MAFRIPYALLKDEHKTQIKKDLSLKEKSGDYNPWKGGRGKFAPSVKSIDFYTIDQDHPTYPELGPDLLIPMYYASALFKTPIPNRRRTYPRVPPFQVKVLPRDYQQEVIDISLRNFMQRGTTFCNVFCSYGKTYVAAYFAAMFSQQYGLATLVTYPRTIIGRSWLGTFKEKSTAKIYVVGETPGPPDADVQVFLCMDTRLKVLDWEIRQRIGHFVLDEADCYCTIGHVEGLLSIEPMFTTVLTATYERDDGFETMLDLLVGPERITRISKKPFFVFQIPTKFEIEPQVGPRGIVFDNVVKQLDANQERNLLIIQLVLDNLDQKILIITKHKEHARNLHQWLGHYLQFYGKTVSILIDNMKKYDDADVLVTTYSKGGRGFDEESGCHNWKKRRFGMGILGSSTKKIEQPMGRYLRSEIPVIFDIVDNQKNLKDHWKLRKTWYESRNGQIFAIDGRFIWAQHRDRMIADYSASLKGAPPEDRTSAGPAQPRPQAREDVSQAHGRSLVASMNLSEMKAANW